MTRLQFRKIGAHYFLPVSLNVGIETLFDKALVDTGATKCSVSIGVNNTYFHLPVVGRDDDVKTATSPQGLEFIRIPKIVVMQEISPAGTFQETDIQEKIVETWLSGDQIIMGMNFLNRYNITMTRDGLMIIER